MSNYYIESMEYRLGSKLLFLKITFLFVFFGLIVGYMSFLTSTALNSFEIYQSFKHGFTDRLQDLFSSEDPDLLYKAFVETPSIGSDIKAVLSSLVPPAQKEKIGFSLYCYLPHESDWITLYSQGFLEAASPPAIELKEKLKDALGSRHIYKPDIFIGLEGRKNLFFDLTSENDRLSYILHISLERDSLGKFLEKEKNTFYTFTSMVLVFSLILGSIFAKSLSRPIQNLADQALILSKGDLNVRFKSKRLDDIGILARSLDRMSLNLKHRFDSMHTMNRIDRAVLSSLSRSELLKKVATYISEQFNFCSVAVFIHKKEGLVLAALVPETDDAAGIVIPYGDLPAYFLQVSNEAHEVSARNLSFQAGMFPSVLLRKKTIAIPILNNEERTATLMISLDQISDQDREALGMLADQAGVALRSMHEMEQREEMSRGILMALTRSVDAKSRWTGGHSERVSELSEALGIKMGLNAEQIQNIRISALLHDIGKLGIPEAILDKPGKLSDDEFKMIKSHPRKGDMIIQNIPGFEEVRLGVRHHHEQWDGRGYPDGLSGKEIPLIARILTLADVYDAISEDRPYRKGFTPLESLQFLKDQSGLIFDPDLLPVFLSIVSDDPLI